MPALEWRAGAQEDLLSVDYISDDNPDAAQRLKDKVEVKAARLPEHPRVRRHRAFAALRGMGERPKTHRHHCVSSRSRSFRPLSSALQAVFRCSQSSIHLSGLTYCRAISASMLATDCVEARRQMCLPSRNTSTLPKYRPDPIERLAVGSRW